MTNGFDSLLESFEHNILHEKCSAFVRTKRGKEYKGYVQGNKFHYEQNGVMKSVPLSAVSDAIVIESKEKWVTCPACKGGMTMQTGTDENGEICYTCQGAGQVPASQAEKVFGEGFELYVESLELNEAMTANALKGKLKRLLTLTDTRTTSLRAYDYFKKQGVNMPLKHAAESVGVSTRYMKKVLQQRDEQQKKEYQDSLDPLTKDNMPDIISAYNSYKDKISKGMALKKAADDNNVDLDKLVNYKKRSGAFDEELEEVKKKYEQTKGDVGAGGIQATMKDKPPAYLKNGKLVGG